MSNDAIRQETPVLVPGGYRETFRVALPLIISMGSFTLMQFCDRMFLAQYSAVSIQAALPAGILAFTLACGFMELSGYANTFVAQYFGAGDRKGCARATAQSIFLALFSWPFMILLIPVGRMALRLAGHAPEVLAEEIAYFDILMMGGVTVPLGVAVGTFFNGRGDTRTTMFANIVANLCNVALDYALIFGHWGCPRLGIAGAAWATVLCGFVSPAILLVLFFSRWINRDFETRAGFRLDPKLLKRLVRFALPSSIHFVLDITSFTFFVLLTGRMGALPLAVSNMAFSINMLAFMPLIGFGIAASTLVGKYQGARQSDHAERAAWSAVKLGVCYSLLVGATFLLFPRFYFLFFTSQKEVTFGLEEVLPLGRWMLVMMAIWGSIDALNVILSGGLKGAGDTRFVMIYSVTMAWTVFVTGEVLIVLKLGGTILQAWAWLTFYIMLLALGFLVRFRRGRWKTIDLLGREVPPSTPSPPRPGGEILPLEPMPE